MPAKVGYILHRFPSPTDTFIRREIEAIRQLGTSVEVLSVWGPGPEETPSDLMQHWKSTTFYLLPASPFKIAWTLLRCAILRPMRLVDTIWTALQTRKPGLKGLVYQLFYLVEALLAADIAISRGYNHLHNHIGDQSGTVTLLAARYSQTSFSITFHGWPVFFDAYNSKLKEKVLASSFTRCISYFCRSQLMLFSGTSNRDPFKVVHCGLDLARYPYRPPKPEVRKIFCAARLSPEKGLEVLIEAVRDLLQQGFDLELQLAGDGPSRPQLQDFCEQWGITENVRFLGYLSEEGIVEALTESDLFVLPSFVEGLPVSAMEAMAVGVPVICTNIAGTAELVEPDATGLLIKPANVNALVEAIQFMISDFGARKRYSLAGRKKVEAEFDLHVEAKKLQSCFEANHTWPHRDPFS